MDWIRFGDNFLPEQNFFCMKKTTKISAHYFGTFLVMKYLRDGKKSLEERTLLDIQKKL